MIHNLIPLITYVLISTFTPGPSNISSASVALLNGYRNSLKYQAGLALGVFGVMFIAGWISTALLGIFPALEPVLRYVGAGYILYLAYGILRASYTITQQNVKILGFISGLALQVLNPKLIVYAFTLFSTFLASLSNNWPPLVLASGLLAAISFIATSTWALFGSAVNTYLKNPKLRLTVNILLALSLVYTAIVLTGLI